MNYKSKLIEGLITFCICTTCITLLQGIMGLLFFRDVRVDYGAFFSPPIFGVLGVLLGIVTVSKKELTVKQVLIRRILHLLLIEGLVFGLNYLVGNIFPPIINITLAVGIAFVFVMVYLISWLDDRRYANDFNEMLKTYQEKAIKHI